MKIEQQRQRRLLIAAATTGFLAVAIGAFGAHALKDILADASRQQYQLAVHYAFYHLAAIIGTALAMPLVGRPVLLYRAGWLFVLGVGLFSGSLILLALSGVRLVAVVTPVGGVVLLCAWGLFIYTLIRRK